jgi:hypothetical protein
MFKDYTPTDEEMDRIPRDTIYIPADIPSIDVDSCVTTDCRLCIQWRCLWKKARTSFVSEYQSRRRCLFTRRLTGILLVRPL